ncbi:MAG: helix-turn-helix domain-containing protein [Burkholderiales bacterium]
MKAWHFTTQTNPQHRQQRAWRDAMGKLRLPVGKLPGTGGFRGTISCIESPLGMQFALVDAEPHEIRGRYLDQPAAIWLTLLIAGDAKLSYDQCTIDLAPGDIAYGPTFADATLSFPRDVRQLFINVQRLTLNPRVFAPLSLRLGCLQGQFGINRVLSSMLLSLAAVIDEVSSEDLRPVELSLTEFLITALGGEKEAFGLGGVAGAKASRLHRICQGIESVLGNPGLTLGTVAERERVSTRYLQKLFAEAGNSFSHYLRTRRLDRCRADLISPLHSELSISEICFRWGFNSSAHFSRVFHKEYGVSPRDYRQLAGGSGAGRVRVSDSVEDGRP